MADNTTQQGNATIGADDIGGVLHQRVKVQYGDDGAAQDVAGATPLPVVADALLADALHGLANSSDSSDTEVIAAQGAGVKIYVTDLIVTNTGAADEDVALKDGTTEVARVAVKAGETVPVSLSKPLPGTANTNFQFAAIAGTSTIYVTATGFKV